MSLNVDCTNCLYLNFAEHEQRMMAITQQHRCLFYNKRLVHKPQEPPLPLVKIFPCKPCKKDKYANYLEKGSEDI